MKLFFIILFVLLSIYVFPPSPEFPQPPTDSVQSGEPADIESPFRRAYYTNLNRHEVVEHYTTEFNSGFKVFAPRLNYPTEDAPLLIRDQTKSTYLEEIVYPLRESLYINGFEPKTEEYAQYYKGIRYNQKIIIRYVPSSVWMRVFVLLASNLLGYFLALEYLNAKKQN